MRILITGGAGFIGSHLVKSCVMKHQHKVYTIDCLTYAGHLENLADVITHPNHQFERVNIIESSKLRRIFERFQPEYVIHCAAESHVDRSLDQAENFVVTNVEGTYHILEASLKYWQQRPKKQQQQFRFLHISTDEVFGALGSDGHFDEQSPYAPNSPYSATKAASDMLVRAYNKTYGLPTLISNCSNNYGPNQYPEKLIPLCILNALEGKPLPIYGDGQQVRDWLYVDDHIEAMLTILEKGQPGSLYCVGGDNEHTNLDVVETICDTLDKIAPNTDGLSYRTFIEFVADRPGHDQRYAIDAHKLKSELGWSPKVSFEQGLAWTVEWYLHSQDWVKMIHAKDQARKRRGLTKVNG